ncbi:MAG: hypothetical protein AAF556_04080 [Pseudomonadota bacterium]
MNFGFTNFALGMMSNSLSRRRRRSSSSRSGSNDNGPDKDGRDYRQQRTSQAVPDYEVLAKFAEGEGRPLPAMPSFDGKPAADAKELMDRAQGFGEHLEISAEDRQKALDGLKAIIDWAKPIADDAKLVQRIGDSATNQKFLDDKRREISSLKGKADGAESSVDYYIDNAYADPKAAKAQFKSMVEAADEPTAYAAAIKQPSILGPIKGIGVGKFGLGPFRGTFVEKIGNYTHNNAIFYQSLVTSNMEDVVVNRHAHAEALHALDQHVQQRPVEEHLVGVANARETIEKLAGSEELRRLTRDITAHQAYETAMVDEPAAAYLQAATIAEGADPGGRWEQLTENAVTEMAKRANELGLNIPELAPLSDEPTPGPTPGPTLTKDRKARPGS